MSASRRTAVFSPERTAVPAARELVRTALRASALPPERTADAVLVTSELVTNAVMHAGTEIGVDCAFDEEAGRLRVEVRDLLPMRQVGAHPPRSPADEPARDQEEAERGLLLTQSLADRWGVSYTKTSKTVWFELAAGPVPAEETGPVLPQNGQPSVRQRSEPRAPLAAGVPVPRPIRERETVARRGYRSWLGFLAEAGDLLAGTLDEKLVLAIAAQLYVPRLATWCAFYLDDQAGYGRLRHVWHADERRLGALRAALEAAEDPRPGRPRETRPWAGLGTLGPHERGVCGPEVRELQLAWRDQRLGVTLLGGPAGGEFRSEPVRLAEDLGDRVGQALLTARRYGEQEAASQVLQRSLLPTRLPAIPGIDYDVVYAPAGRNAAAGGDFYDLFPAGPGRWRFMLGDVAGTGPEAAAVTGLARHTLRALAREGHTAAGALDRLNETIIDDAWSRMLTVLHGELEPVMPDPANTADPANTVNGSNGAGGVRLSVAAAGHPLPLRLRPDGGVTPVGGSQILLGAVRESTYRLDSVRLARGDLLLCVTDGITERRNGGRLLDDDDGLARILAGCAGLPARAVTRRVQTAVRGFATDPLDDDMAILALRVAPDAGDYGAGNADVSGAREA
ncbi:SpoIIE family protein phosphatase [Actinomadura sp. 9N407]|uniref:SpoIIE family protein phosphatase n=1 Tax=Actinomadura sp. 9N407 TaxID=3375154 RepID=UPI0037B06D36